MGEARRKRLLDAGAPIDLRPSVDMDAAIEDLEKAIEAGQVAGFLQIGLLRDIAPGVFPIKMWTFGVDKQQAYDALCLMKKAMEKTMGFKDA